MCYILSSSRQSLPLSGLSNAQLAEHYADCIKLSTENVSVIGLQLTCVNKTNFDFLLCFSRLLKYRKPTFAFLITFFVLICFLWTSNWLEVILTNYSFAVKSSYFVESGSSFAHFTRCGCKRVFFTGVFFLVRLVVVVHN